VVELARLDSTNAAFTPTDDARWRVPEHEAPAHMYTVVFTREPGGFDHDNAMVDELIVPIVGAPGAAGSVQPLTQAPLAPAPPADHA
jgi:hypothetical protein